VRRPVVLLALAAAGTLALAAPAAAATQYTLDEKVTVRNGPGDYVLGYAYGNDKGPNTPHSDHFDVQATHGRWLYGHVEGAYGRWGGQSQCGWVLPGSGRLHANGRTAPDVCPSPNLDAYSPANPLAPRNLFTPGTWFQGTGGGTVYPAVVTACAAGTYAYGNFDPATGDFSNRYGLMPVGRGTRTDGGRGAAQGYPGFGIRYVAGGAVMLKDSQAGGGRPTWFFMRTGCITATGPLFTPQMKLRGASWRGRTVRVNGRMASSVPGHIGTARPSLLVSFACAKGSRRTSVHYAAGRLNGKRYQLFSTRLRQPAACRGARKGTVSVTYPGDVRQVRQTKSATVRHR
jgi:hypothetical protein